MTGFLTVVTILPKEMGQKSCSFPQPEEFGYKQKKSTQITRLQGLSLHLLHLLFVVKCEILLRLGVEM